MHNIFKTQEYRLDDDVRKIMILADFIGLGILSTITLCVSIFLIIKEYISMKTFFIILSINLSIFIITLVYSLFSSKLYQKYYSYSFTKEAIIITSGIFSKNKDYIPYHIIQNIDVATGPIMRKYNYSNLKLHLIRGYASINYIKNDRIEAIKQSILDNKNQYNLKY